MSTPAHRTVSGASYFVTTKCWQGRSLFQVPEVAEILLNTLFCYRDSGAYLLHEFVIMPDHLHLMLTPNSESSLEKAVQLIKGGSSHRIHKERGKKTEIWQVGFHDWTIRDLDDWKAKANYIYMNPVKARLCERAEEWPSSSANGKFCLDPMPEKYENLASGAKAPIVSAFTQRLKPLPPKEGKQRGLGPILRGLKSLPPKEQDESAESPSLTRQAHNVGPKGSTRSAVTVAVTTQQLKPWPPKEQEKAAEGCSAARRTCNVGPEGPAPVAITKETRS
jgi:REP-associated tyrosine transposase